MIDRFLIEIIDILPFYQDKTASFTTCRTLILGTKNELFRLKKSLNFEPMKMILIDFGNSCHKTL